MTILRIAGAKCEDRVGQSIRAWARGNANEDHPIGPPLEDTIVDLVGLAATDSRTDLAHTAVPRTSGASKLTDGYELAGESLC